MKNNHSQLIDRYNRRLNYLRISITDRCNLRCFYCMPRDGIAKLGHTDILTYEEILRLARIAVSLGVDKIRLTGGEPLIRREVNEFLPQLTAIPGLKDVSLTTNGIYLRENLEKIKSSGIKRINVSLDTLQRERYEMITGYDGFQEVWEAIELANKLNLRPIKINVVVIRGINDDELLDFARLSQQHSCHIRFIEYMPFRAATPAVSLHHIPSSLIKAQLSKLGKLIQVPKKALDGPAERFRFEGAPGEIGFISAVTDHFCPVCNRLRLTASGHLRPCLLSDQEEDLKGPMRSGVSDDGLVDIFFKASLNKPCAHHLASDDSIPFPGEMSSIGG